MKITTDPRGTREYLSSEDGQFMFTLPMLPPADEIAPEITEAHAKQRAEFVAVVEDRDVERTERQRWARYQKEVRKNLGSKSFGKLKLSKDADGVGYEPAPFGLGDWVEWTPEGTDTPVIGSVWAQAGTHTWYVVTDRSAVTGEYHYLSRSGSKKDGWTHAVDSVPVRSLGNNPPEQLPFEQTTEVPGAKSAESHPQSPAAPVRKAALGPKVTSARRYAGGSTLDEWDVTVDSAAYTLEWTGPGGHVIVRTGDLPYGEERIIGYAEDIEAGRDLCTRHAKGETRGLLSSMGTDHWSVDFGGASAYVITRAVGSLTRYEVTWLTDRVTTAADSLSAALDAARDHYESPEPETVPETPGAAPEVVEAERAMAAAQNALTAVQEGKRVAEAADAARSIVERAEAAEGEARAAAARATEVQTLPEAQRAAVDARKAAQRAAEFNAQAQRAYEEAKEASGKAYDAAGRAGGALYATDADQAADDARAAMSDADESVGHAEAAAQRAAEHAESAAADADYRCTTCELFTCRCSEICRAIIAGRPVPEYTEAETNLWECGAQISLADLDAPLKAEPADADEICQTAPEAYQTPVRATAAEARTAAGQYPDAVRVREMDARREGRGPDADVVSTLHCAGVQFPARFTSGTVEFRGSELVRTGNPWTVTLGGDDVSGTWAEISAAIVEYVTTHHPDAVVQRAVQCAEAAQITAERAELAQRATERADTAVALAQAAVDTASACASAAWSADVPEAAEEHVEECLRAARAATGSAARWGANTWDWTGQSVDAAEAEADRAQQFAEECTRVCAHFGLRGDFSDRREASTAPWYSSPLDQHGRAMSTCTSWQSESDGRTSWTEPGRSSRGTRAASPCARSCTDSSPKVSCRTLPPCTGGCPPDSHRPVGRAISPT
ncbi:hypothetical protein [Streptomyces mirabilis]|uniref:hypothetical protein n=1 Tax=Streptomyces mirabilis TaxID=68239 RepID=UPI003685BC67